jgi:hypothetical protein
MSNIIITDSQGFSVLIGAGMKNHTPTVNAFSLQGWKETPNVFRALQELTRSGPNPVNYITDGGFAADAFGIPGGDCMFDTGSLFFFNGPIADTGDNVLMVLWQFRLNPKAGDHGSGQLNAPPANGVLAGGEIDWEYEPHVISFSGAVP